MLQITIKLFASLRPFMPEGAVNSQAPLDCTTGATVSSVLKSLNVPTESCHLVILNGVFIAPGQRSTTALKNTDTLAVWPPVAGG